MRLLVAVLGAPVGGFMLFDGTRALIVGDYIRPTSGRYAGRLGPWAEVVVALGIDPLSTSMKVVFIVYGLVWLAALTWFVVRPGGAARGALIAMATATLWYLTIGTIFSIVLLAVLLVGKRRQPAS